MWSSFLPGVDRHLGHVCGRKEVDGQIRMKKVRTWTDVVNEAGAVAEELDWFAGGRSGRLGKRGEGMDSGSETDVAVRTT